jgi:hypothetical protein
MTFTPQAFLFNDQRIAAHGLHDSRAESSGGPSAKPYRIISALRHNNPFPLMNFYLCFRKSFLRESPHLRFGKEKSSATIWAV